MKRLLFLLPLFALLSNQSTGQVIGTTFPEMSAETVEDKVITLPKDSNGKYTLVGLAYSKKSEDDLNTWLRPVYNTFIYKPEKPGLFTAFAYDVNVYFIPMFTGVKAAAQGTAKKKAAAGVDPLLHPNLLFFKGQLKTYKKTLDFDKKDVPYFFVLDPEGTIVYATSGAYSETNMNEIEDKVLEGDN